MKELEEPKSRKIPINRVRAFRKRLVFWYQEGGRNFPWRDSSASEYEKIISEVLLQRTKAETVANFYPEFIHKYPSWEVLAEVHENILQDSLKPIGLWRRRAQTIRLLSGEMVKRKGRFPKNQEELLSLPGIGQYIGNAIMIFCHGQNYPLLDTNMARVLERFFGPRRLADIRYDPYLQDLAHLVVQETNPQVINWSILDLAATICKINNPLCNTCPVKLSCRFLKEHKTGNGGEKFHGKIS